jgi:hypothetical protein
MNELLNPAVIGDLAERLSAVAPERDLGPLQRITAAQLEPLSLRERTDLVSAALIEALAANYSAAAAIVRGLLVDPAFRGWGVWPVGETMATLALVDGSAAAFDDALALMAELTPRLTSEFPIRRLLEADLGRALPLVLAWTGHPDEHVRRLASEGTRAYLPWAIRVRALLADPSATVPIIDALYRDPSDYVRRSVANHLNDLARHDPGAPPRHPRAGGTGQRAAVRPHGVRAAVLTQNTSAANCARSRRQRGSILTRPPWCPFRPRRQRTGAPHAG